MFVGVAAAFAVQWRSRRRVRRRDHLLPDRLVAAAVAVLFGIGAVLLFREGFANGDDDSADELGGGARGGAVRRAALTSFGVLFAAEWGDASQLATAG